MVGRSRRKSRGITHMSLTFIFHCFPMTHAWMLTEAMENESEAHMRYSPTFSPAPSDHSSAAALLRNPGRSSQGTWPRPRARPVADEEARHLPAPVAPARC